MCSVFAFSQEIKFGVKGGLNISSLRGNYPSEIEKTESSIGFNIGGFAEYQINDKFSLQPELLFSTQGGKVQFGNVDIVTQQTKLSYLQLPVMLKYKIIDKLHIEFGPQIGYIVGARSQWEYKDSESSSNNESLTIDLLNDGTYKFLGTTFAIKPKLNRLDFGLNIGASFDFTEKFFVQTRYNFGLTTIDENSTNGSSTNSWNLKNSVIQISTGYKF